MDRRRTDREILAELEGWRDRRAAGTITGPEFHEAHNRLQQEMAEGRRQAQLRAEAAEEARRQAEWQQRQAESQAEAEARRQAKAEAWREKLRQTDPGCPYKTLKDAYADGWRDVQPDDYSGERLRLKGHDLARNADKAVSETEWRRRGYTVKPEEREQPHATVSGQVGGLHGLRSWYVYREDQVFRTARQQAAAERQEMARQERQRIETERQRIEADCQQYLDDTGFLPGR